MSRHSKNSTAAPIFRYSEKQRLKEYGTIKERIGRDSMKKFDCCHLCLHPVTNPVACPQGHLFCKECIFEALLTQKKEIKRAEKKFEADQKRLLEEEQKRQEEQVAAQIQQMEKLQYGALPQDAIKQPTRDVIQALQDKRPDSLREHKEWIKTSFWVPEQTPTAAPLALVKPSTETCCPVNKHQLRLKQLIDVKMDLVDQSDDTHVNATGPVSAFTYQCYACKKSLNQQKISVLKSCGHVMCTACITKFCLPEGRCMVCNQKCKDKDVISLEESGTGFSSHNKVESSTYLPAFQG
eukprot:GILJ01004653.1.p1 GENE.GILJ01004653.1~~GILJ01004653.1.p1  ORF type:complete len:314 (-),score=52.31 GILJ01004653.1:145-1029(-)